jgi:hypothetical protein
MNREAEGELEQMLEAGRLKLINGETSLELLRLLRSHSHGPTDNLYLIASLPEQAEDMYDILIDGRLIVRVEMPRDGISQFPSIEEMSLGRYQQLSGGMSRLMRRRLDAAIRLAERRRATD